METNTTTSLPGNDMLLPEEVVHGRAIRNVYIWVLVGVGLPGNLACVLTVLSMPVTTATFYVALLAAADSLALLLKLLFHQLVSHAKMTAAACVFYFTPTFFSCYANWVLALICFERFVTVCFPLKKDAYFTKRRVGVSVAILTAALAVCFGPTPFFYTDVMWNGKRCVQNVGMLKFKEEFFDVFLASLYFFAPFFLIAVLTTLIIIGLYRNRQARQRIGGVVVTEGGATSEERNVELSISVMLLCAGLVFLLLLLPACLYHLALEKLFDASIMEERAQVFLFYQVITMLADTNHAVNFIIYFLSAPRFRKRFVELARRGFCFKRGEESGATASSSEDAIRLTQLSQTQTQDSGKGADQALSA
ncbi:sex peptide receptor-related protein 2-like [Babylonia areolata]|uniref:sex peptide receptor-related protein 2-like n=1 Tax=Babylonia areolata TaxID=304850 RepID=UPI003FD21336